MMVLPSSSNATVNANSYSTEASASYTNYSDKTEGDMYSRTWTNVVLSNNKRYGFKVSGTNDHPVWITKYWKCDKGFAYHNTDNGTRDYTWYVVDSSGNSVDWTGYLAVRDIDSNERVQIPTSCYLGCVGKGQYVNSPTSSSDYSGYTVIRGSQSSTSGGENGNKYDIILKIRIPSTGLQTHLKGGKICFGMTTSRIQNNTLEAEPGKWE